MTSPADAHAPAPAHRDADSGWGTKIALGVAGFIMVVEFMLPGLLAAGFSRAGNGVYSVNNGAWGPLVLPVMPDNMQPPAVTRAELFVLAPPVWLMEHSRAIFLFYMWQYQLAGGRQVGVGK